MKCGGIEPTLQPLFRARGRLCLRSAMGDTMEPKTFIAAVEKARRSKEKFEGRGVTALHVKIAVSLAYARLTNPSHRSLARRAGCSSRTVRRALRILHGLGLLSWTRIVVRGRGWRAQVSSAYQLLSCKPLSFLGIKTSASLSASGETAEEARAELARIRSLRAGLLASSRMPCRRGSPAAPS